jgi:chloramphenicol 3-O phosphotransferase
MSKIIFLNGCGSSGKTSIARCLQSLSDKPWMIFGVDTLFEMLPPEKIERYVSFARAFKAKILSFV